MRKSFAALLGATALAGCHVNAQESGGATVSKNYQIGNFQEIEVAGPYEVEVRTGANPSVSARGSEKLLERTVVEIRGDKLVIHPENNHSFFNFGWGHHGKASFTVTVPQLSAATIAGSGDIRVDKVQGNSFEGTVAGSGGIQVNSLNVQDLKFAIAGSGGVKADSGKAQSAKYDIAGSGDVDAGGIQTQTLKVSIAGSGDVKAHATGTADVSIMGAGDVDVSGGAKCTVSKSGSGDVRCS
jgi:hypothetical protein